MPSTPKLLFDLTISVGLLFGGAWLAGELSSPAGATEKAPTTAAIETTASLSLTIDGVRNNTGKVIVMVFDEEKAFANYDYEQTVAFREMQAATGTMEVPFEKLTDGPYAIALFHDENEDYDLNLENGLPLEGYGTSGARGMYDDPGFQQALVKPGDVTVQMYYLQ